MKKRPLLCMLLALLVLSAVPSASASNWQRTERLPLRDNTPSASASYARFLDVPSTHWGKDGISYVVDQGLFNGTASDRFSPDDTMNLAMLCTVLYRFGGSPSVGEKSLHTDFAARWADMYNNAYAMIPKGEWYSDAMVWALKNEILNYPRYYVPSAMDPDAAITRGEFCVMLRNFYAYSGGGRVNDYITWLENTYKDLRSTVMDPRYESMSWAYTYGIINGTGDTTMSPDMLMTRAQAAAMLERYARQFGTGKPIDPPAPEGYDNNFMAKLLGATDDKAVEELLIQAVNAYNAENGLAPLAKNDRLMDAADIRVRELISNYSHTRQDGTDADTVLSEVGMTGWTLTQELISRHYTRETGIVAAWKNTAELNAALLTTDASAEIGVSFIPPYDEHVVLLIARNNGGQTTAPVPQQTSESTPMQQQTSEPAPAPQTVEPTTEPAEQVDVERQFTIAGTAYALGMTVEELTELAGQPDETAPSSTGGNWYIFGTKTYLDFFMADVLDGKVVRLASGGKALSYQGNVAGTKGATASGGYARLYTDSNDGGILHAVMLRESTARETAFDAEALRGESVANFHMVNAFRVYHGLKAYQWDESAATAARLHSEDLAEQNYFSHYSQDGRSPWDRMEAQGIRSKNAAENISAGNRNGVEAYDGWVNSSGHRDNMLGPYTWLGVGAGYSASSTYRWYMTQVFYAPS